MASIQIDHTPTTNDSHQISSGSLWRGQTFTPSSSFSLTGVLFKASYNGSAITMTMTIWDTDGAGLPDNQLGSVTFQSDVFSSHPTTSDVQITLNTPIAVTSGTLYAVSVSSDSATGSNWLSLRGRNVPFEPSSYANGTVVDSVNDASSWFKTTLDDLYFQIWGDTGNQITPVDKSYTSYLVTAGGDKVFYGTSMSNMTKLTAADDDIDCTVGLTTAEAFQKLFIANDSNLKVVDLVNTKIATSDVGTHPPDRGNILTGGTSGAAMVVDYITTTSGACTIYGFRTSTDTFSSGETVTGTDDDGNSISFTTSAAETAPPHWYDWTVYGGDTTTYGNLPTRATLVCRYFGRVILAGHEHFPHVWWASRVEDPFDYLFSATDPLSGYKAHDGSAGEIGDIIRALIPFGDDFLVFGCANSISVLMGDPGSDGQINEVTNETGIFGPFSWCKDNDGNLYFIGNNGLYMMPQGQMNPKNISVGSLPQLVSDWAFDITTHRVTLTYDPIRHGVLISRTKLSDGSNENYWHSLKTKGFYPESYPTECGIFSSVHFTADADADRTTLYGTYDGFIRHFDDTQKDDDAGESGDTAVDSYVTFPIFQMGSDKDSEGKLTSLTFDVSGGASGGDFSDSDGFDWEVHVGDDAETVLEDIRDGATAFSSGSVSTTGRQTRIRDRSRGAFLGIKIRNNTAAETWAVNNVFGDVKIAGRIK